MAVMYGILTAILWGVADYYARFSTRRIGTFRTLCYMEAVGVTALTIWLAASGQLIGMFALALPRMWAWVVFSALLSTVASLAFYRALSFVKTGFRPAYYAEPIEDAVLMRLPLAEKSS